MHKPNLLNNFHTETIKKNDSIEQFYLIPKCCKKNQACTSSKQPIRTGEYTNNKKGIEQKKEGAQAPSLSFIVSLIEYLEICFYFINSSPSALRSKPEDASMRDMPWEPLQPQR